MIRIVAESEPTPNRRNSSLNSRAQIYHRLRRRFVIARGKSFYVISTRYHCSKPSRGSEGACCSLGRDRPASAKRYCRGAGGRSFSGPLSPYRPNSFDPSLAHQPFEPKTVSTKSRTRASGNGVFVISRQKKMAPSSAKAPVSGSMRGGKSRVAIPLEINSTSGLRASV